MTDLAQSVCRIWRKAYVGFGAKRFWASPQTGFRTTEVVIGAIYTVGRQTNGGVYGWDGGGVCRGWWRGV